MMALNKQPKVTVLMPVFNAALFLDESIKSILNQTFQGFELLIIDDGSTDGSPEIINEFDDDRIRLILLDKNGGIVAALNFGLELARGDYLARMDADDIAFPNRLEKQVDFLEKNPDIGCLGTDFLWLNQPYKKSWIQYYDPENIQIALLFGCELCHPTVMLRMTEVRRHNLSYPTDYPHAEDYGFWVELSRYMRLSNLHEPLLYYRKHEGQVSQVKKDIQCRTIDQIQVMQLQNLGIKPTSSDIMLHHSLGGAFIPLPGLESYLLYWCQRLLEANYSNSYFTNNIFTMHLRQRIVNAVESTNNQLTNMSHIRRFHWKLTTWWRYISNSQI